MAVAQPRELLTRRPRRSEQRQLRTVAELEGVRMTGAQITCAALEAEGADLVFGYPGGAVIPLYDAIPSSNLHHVLVRFEQWAALAADGYARATGKVGVCIATSGPGATNLVTGLANSQLDSVPVVAITGQVGQALIGRDAFQETDITGITLPITKHNYLVQSADEIAPTIKEAFYLARSGRPGPVLVDIPKNVFQESAKFHMPGEINRRGYQPSLLPNTRQIRLAGEMINAAKKPLIMAGHGIMISGAEQEFERFVERTGIPVIFTLLGQGSFPESHRLSLGLMGMHGHREVNMALKECDLLVNIGARFDDRATGKVSTFAPNARVVHCDIDPAEIGKNVTTDVPVVGDAREVLKLMLGEVNEREHNDWLAWIHGAEGRGAARGAERPAGVAGAVHDHQGNRPRHERRGDLLHRRRAASDVGRPAPRPRSSPTLADLRRARHDGLRPAGGDRRQDGRCRSSEVWTIIGDGGFQMSSNELATCVQEQLDINIAVINNGYLGMVRQWQDLFHQKNYSEVEILGPDFVKLAEAYGATGIRVTRDDEIVPAIEKARSIPGPVLIEFVVEPEANVWPIVPPGASNSDMMLNRGEE